MAIGLSEEHEALRESVRGWASREIPSEVVRAAVAAEREERPPFWAGLADTGPARAAHPRGTRRVRVRPAGDGRRARGARRAGGARAVPAHGAGERRGARRGRQGARRAAARVRRRHPHRRGRAHRRDHRRARRRRRADHHRHGAARARRRARRRARAAGPHRRGRGVGGDRRRRGHGDPARQPRPHPRRGQGGGRRPRRARPAGARRAHHRRRCASSPRCCSARRPRALASWCVTAAAEYAKVRVQFGRPIGQFQGIKHKLARMLVALEQARATVWDGWRPRRRAHAAGEEAPARRPTSGRTPPRSPR